jgi:signal transduction histidine kinase
VYKRQDYSLLVNIKKEVQHLNKMVGEFLAMGKPKPLILKEFPLHELVEEVNILIKRQLQEKNIEVLQFIDKSLRVVADKEQLRLVLLNLFLNAGSAIGDNGLIEITAQSNNGEILLNVKDNGCGIRDDDLPKIFEPYFTTRDDGTGLGLALVKRIVEDHGGTITAGNNESRGATFTITLNQMLGNNNGKSIDS